MNESDLKLTIYFGERDRAGSRFLAEHLLDIFEQHRLRVSLLMRGVEGFGVKHHLHTTRLLTLSEDLPLVAVAVDAGGQIRSALAEIEKLAFEGLVTLERVRMLAPRSSSSASLEQLGEAGKLTLYFGRGARFEGRPPHERAVRMLHEAQMAGATVLLGVDGTIGGKRRRASFFSANAEVPVMVVSVGASSQISALVPELAGSLQGSLLTLERLRVLKRDGARVAELEPVPETDANGMNLWQKLNLYSSEQASFEGHPVHVEAIRRLRREGASGATALRGIWGYDGRHRPHGDSFWSLRRRVPTMTVTVDAPARIQEWFEVLDQITPERGVITSEIVPAFRATGPEVSRGGLRLAAHRPPPR